MLFIKAIVKTEEGDVVFSQCRNEATTKICLAKFVEALKEKHGEAEYYFDDVHEV